MKKAILSVMLILALTLCACQRQPKVQTARSFRVTVRLECADVYGIGLEYCIDRKLMGVQAVQNAKESRPIGRGESLSFEFTEMDFSQAELEKGAFGILPEILLKDGESVSAQALWEWQARFDEEYHFVLTRAEDGTFSFEPTEDGYACTPSDEVVLN